MFLTNKRGMQQDADNVLAKAVNPSALTPDFETQTVQNCADLPQRAEGADHHMTDASNR